MLELVYTVGRSLPKSLRIKDMAIRMGFNTTDWVRVVLYQEINAFIESIEPETIEMKFIDPIAPIGNKKFTDLLGIGPVKVNRFTPVVLLVTGGEKMVGKNADVISIRPEMVVNDVENNAEA